ncbi:hypothetical protein LJ656_33130 [Paraburkholderia sp. MMS20-SJTR3]|uniref:Uncharacterized protein n=1 Tax=Paraburkholderia sejongensis TaxID=2886946 RepID=A0ABS8K6C1_9BURK|nr:hypothetical protein [Paraburkholderia sp. MMS20-SJTR3]MCC8397408.1 hypothetical protein [Paraburkholderia sp. MMS20-SJTR3]
MDVISVAINDTRVAFCKASVISLQKFNDYFTAACMPRRERAPFQMRVYIGAAR